MKLASDALHSKKQSLRLRHYYQPLQTLSFSELGGGGGGLSPRLGESKASFAPSARPQA